MTSHSVTPVASVRMVFHLLAVVALVGCSERSAVPPPVDADGGDAMDASMIAMDTPPLVDRAVDSARPTDISLDARDAADVGLDRPPTRDNGGADGGAVADSGTLPDVPVDPMGVPLPGSECTGDAGVRGGDPTIAPPRPILPQSVSRVTSQRPSFRWALPVGTTGARVEVCADRCCTRVLQTLEAEGMTVRPPTALPPGVVYWRMFGRAGGMTGSRASYTWEFEVRRRDTPVDSSWGTIRDFTGDGYDDLLLLAAVSNSDGTRNMYVAEGAEGGPRAPRVFVSLAIVPSMGTERVGDFNGDGRSDLAYLASVGSLHRPIDVIESTREGVPRVVRLEVASALRSSMSAPAVTDWNGDGYSDVVTTVYLWESEISSIAGSILVVYHGSPTGLGAMPQQVARFGPPITRPWVEMDTEVGDFDLDGYGDVHLTNRWSGGGSVGSTVLHGGREEALRIEPFPDPFGRPDSERDLPYVLPVGDLDGDGRPDLVSAPPRSGRVFVYLNSAGLSEPTVELTEIPHPGGSVGFGDEVKAGDFNGDGRADLAIAAPGSYVETGPLMLEFNTGRLYIHMGSAEGPVGAPIWFARVRPTDRDYGVLAFAGAVASPGDLDGDGIDDVALIDVGRSTICYIMGRVGLTGAYLDGCLASPGYGRLIY